MTTWWFLPDGVYIEKDYKLNKVDRMKWEYTVLNIEVMHEKFGSSFKEMLDTNGNEGWELVSVDNGIAYFKRELRNVSKPKITHITDDNSARVIFKQSYDD